MSRSLVVNFLLLLLLPLPALADSVEISGGGHLTGKAKRQAGFVIVEVDDEVQVALPASRVRRIVESDELQRYRENAAKAGDDAETHYKLAIWCKTGNNVPGLSDYYVRFHMQKAVELDPEHEAARASLGYKKQDGKWIRTTDLMHDRGMISVGGRWQLPEAAAIEDSADSVEKQAKKWKAEVNRLLAIASKNSLKSAEAYATLEAIADPLAASAIATQLADSRGNRSQSVTMRRMWIKLLGRFKNRTSVMALVDAGLNEPDDNIREAALTELQEFGGSSAAATYLPLLKHNDHRVVNRAARALTWFPDPERSMDYVNALVTTKVTQGPVGPGMDVGFGDSGVNGMTSGVKPSIDRDTRTNPAVLTLLKMVQPDADFGYDEQAWRRYLAARKTRYSGDLRRDP